MSDFFAQPFPVTRWSLIVRARGPRDPDTRAALDELIRRYLPALRTHLLLRRRLDPDQADELLQNFIASRFVEQSLLANVGPEKGRFRTFLLRAMNNFLVDQIRARRAQKRGGGEQTHSLDVEDSAHLHPADSAPDPAGAFDLAWARQVIDQAADVMRQRCIREDRADIWEVFTGRVLSPTLEGRDPIGYDELITRFGYETPEQAANVLTTGKRSFQRALREVVGDYCDDTEIEDELRELQAVVARQHEGPR